MPDHDFIPNQVFVGLPWKTVRPRYERIIQKLEGKFPVYFRIVGRHDAQNAVDLLGVIKASIDASSAAIFDATGGNANVSLEYGYAEARGITRYIFLSTHRSAGRTTDAPIISDLVGMRRVQYKTEATLSRELHQFCERHDYIVRYETAVKKLLVGFNGHHRRAARAMALALIRQFDGEEESLRRAALIQTLQANGFLREAVDRLLRIFHEETVITISPGRFSEVRIS